ncbi:MAG: histidine kinase [Burkholderiales bacterium]|nr:histidine kinase [Burkholderiales bacterium]
MFVLLIPAIGKARIRGWSETGRTLFFGGVPLAGVAIGWPTGFWLVRRDADDWLARVDGDVVVGILLMSLLFSFVFFQIFSARSRQVVAERRALEAQLKLLQAQMEPHFLFNTLAGVQTLIDTEPDRAKRMLESFTDYLRATVGSLRTEDSTLAAELALADAYLALMRERMEDRLRYTVQADEGLQHARLPALMLQPLVENAIQHGLEPKVEGGTVRIGARRDGDALLVEVCDDGRGPEAPPRRGGHGVALDNLRQRLRGRWGDAASLTLAPAAPGTRATLRIPLEANETR